MPSSYTTARISKTFRKRLDDALSASGVKESDVVRASVDEFITKYDTPEKIRAAIMRSLRRQQ